MGIEAGAAAIISSLVGAAATLLAPKPEAPKAPKTAPMPNEDAVKEDARRKAIAEQMARRGRASTILTDQSDTLG